MLTKSDLQWVAKHFYYDTKETYCFIDNELSAGKYPRYEQVNHDNDRINLADVLLSAAEVLCE